MLWFNHICLTIFLHWIVQIEMSTGSMIYITITVASSCSVLLPKCIYSLIKSHCLNKARHRHVNFCSVGWTLNRAYEWIFWLCALLAFSENPSYPNMEVAVYHRSDIPNPRINSVCPSVVKQDGFNSPLAFQHDNFHVTYPAGLIALKWILLTSILVANRERLIHLPNVRSETLVSFAPDNKSPTLCVCIL